MRIVRIFSIISAYVLIMCLILLTVLSGISYKFFNTDTIIFFANVNLKVLFGCGIGVGLLLLLLIWIYFGFPKLFVNYVITFPTLIVICSLYIVYTRPSEVNRMLNVYSLLWSESTAVKIFQVRNQCCGWNNSTDRSLSYCPITYESGCANLLGQYLRPRYHDIYISSILILAVSMVCSIILLVLFLLSTENSIFDLFEF